MTKYLLLLSLLVRWDGSTDPATSQWYNSLKLPGSTSLCCSQSDCRPTEERIVDGHREVWIGKTEFGPDAPDQWMEVPAYVVLKDTPNPTGKVVACYYGSRILCVVLITGT